MVLIGAVGLAKSTKGIGFDLRLAQIQSCPCHFGDSLMRTKLGRCGHPLLFKPMDEAPENQ